MDLRKVFFNFFFFKLPIKCYYIATMLTMFQCKMESYLTEIGLLVTEIDYILENLKQWMAPAEVSLHKY